MGSLWPWINHSASLDFGGVIYELGTIRIYLSVDRRLMRWCLENSALDF